MTLMEWLQALACKAVAKLSDLCNFPFSSEWRCQIISEVGRGGQILCCTAIYRSTGVLSLKGCLWLLLLPHLVPLKPGCNFCGRRTYESNHTYTSPTTDILFFITMPHLDCLVKACISITPFFPFSYNWSFIFIVSISVNDMKFPDW